jgi:hypothetical protein
VGLVRSGTPDAARKWSGSARTSTRGSVDVASCQMDEPRPVVIHEWPLDALRIVGQDAPMGNRSISSTAATVCTAFLLAGCAIAPSFSQDEKRQMRDSASVYQQAVLEDLVVTESEYRDAVDATRDCVQDKGWGVGPLTEQDGNQLGFQSSYSGDAPPANEEMQACNNEFVSQVGPIWVSQRAPLTR